MQDNRKPDYDICTRNQGKNIKNQRNVGSKWDDSTKENSWQNKKIDRIRSQQIWESCGIQSINEWEEIRRRREWDQHETRMDAEKLVKISRDNIHCRPNVWDHL